MQPHHQLPRRPHTRLITSDYPSQLPPLRTYSLLTSSKPLNISSRTILDSPTFRIPRSSTIRELTELDSHHGTTLPRPFLEQDIAPPRPQSMCHFCNDSFDADEIMAHAADCDMQKISCEKCGQRILMQIYDIHFEECGTLTNHVESIELRSPMYGRRIVRMEDDDDDSVGEETGRRDMFQEINAMSYEQLLLLDETIEKKGLSEEEMRGFKVQLHIKSLDGEGSCNICLSDYETAEYTRELSCKHKFHKNCIDKWLEAHITCPMCKKYFR